MAKYLVITHQLSHTGAPIVLLDLVRALKGAEQEVEMISLLDGDLRQEVKDLGIPLCIQNQFIHNQKAFCEKVSGFDCVIVNTLLGYEPIHLLKELEIPVLWWIHEGEHFFEYFQSVIPDFGTLPEHIHVYAVSGYVQRIIQKRYGVTVPILHFGVEDHWKEASLQKLQTLLDYETTLPDWEDWDPGHGKVRFLTVAVYGEVKGQDFAVEAIRGLPETLRRQCEFVFCGEEDPSQADGKILGPVLEASASYPEVHHIPRHPHDVIMNLMGDMDYLLVPSRIEPMPTVACEAMMMGKPVVISHICGVADDMTDGWDGFIFSSEDTESLQDAIQRSVTLRRKQKDSTGHIEYEEMATRCRKLYEQCYAMEVFKPRALKILEHISRRRKLLMMLSGRDILDIFSEAMEPTFRALGYEVLLFRNTTLVKSLGELDHFLETPVTAALAFNNTGMRIEVVPGKNLWEQLQIPYIDFLMDHPFAHKDALDHIPSTGIVLCPDRNHMKYVQRYYPDISITGFMGHGGKESGMHIKSMQERNIDLIYAGNLSRSFVDQIRPDFRKDFSEYDIDMERIAVESLEDLIQHPSQTTESVIEKHLLEEGYHFMDAELNEIIEKLHYIDLLAVSHYREMTVRLLAEAGAKIHLYGTGWEDCTFINLPNVRYGGRISAEDVVAEMHDAKMVLSTMTWFKDGTHDRVFNGMLSGAVAVTDTSLYMKEHFNGIRWERGAMEGVEAGTGWSCRRPELMMFELERTYDNYRYPTIEEMPSLVLELLRHPEEMQRIADAGRMHALESETWSARAKEMDEDLLEML